MNNKVVRISKEIEQLPWFLCGYILVVALISTEI